MLREIELASKFSSERWVDGWGPGTVWLGWMGAWHSVAGMDGGLAQCGWDGWGPGTVQQGWWALKGGSEPQQLWQDAMCLEHVARNGMMAMQC